MENLLNTLDLVEQKFNEVASLLASGEASALEPASAGLRDLTLQLARLLPQAARGGPTRKTLEPRLRALASGIQVLRENLSRRAAFVEQSVRVLVPMAAAPAYSVGGAKFGSAVLHSGAFRPLAA